MQSECRLEFDGYALATITVPERCIYQGHSYRVGTGYQTLSVGQYASVSFVTPATGYSQYAFSIIGKTGNECLVTLIEGGEYTGGSTATPWNINRIIGDANCPFTCKSGGAIANGLAAPDYLIPGTAQGNVKPGGSSESPANILLKQNTRYTLKITAKGDVTLAAIIIISWMGPKGD